MKSNKELKIEWSGDMKIQTVQGDITKVEDLEAIVNAANRSLLGGVGRRRSHTTGRREKSCWKNAGR